jgi:hypothetical protein
MLHVLRRGETLREGAGPLPALLLETWGLATRPNPYLLFALGRRRKERESMAMTLGRSNVLSSLPIGERHG